MKRTGLAALLVLAAALLAADASAAPLRAAAGPPVPSSPVGGWSIQANADDVRSLARDGDVLWAGSAGGGVARWSVAAGAWRQYLAPDDGLPSNDVRDIAAWRGQWWFATDAGLAVYGAETDGMRTMWADLPSSSITALAVDDDDRLWVAMEPVWDGAATAEGSTPAGAWIGGGLAVTADGLRFRAFGLADGLPSSSVADVTTWRGDVWCATMPYRSWRPPHLEAGEAVPGRWVLDGGGVARLDGERWIPVDPVLAGDLGKSATRIAGGERALWVGTAGRGLVAFDGARWVGHTDCGDPVRCISDNAVVSLAVDGGGRVWVGTARFNGRGTGVAVLDDGGTPTEPDDDRWRSSGDAGSLPGPDVHAILVDAAGGAWLGTSVTDADGEPHGTGIARLSAGLAVGTVLRSASAGLGAPPDNTITAVARHPLSGELWVGTSRGGLAVRAGDGSWRQISRASTGGNLGSDDIADIAIEGNGTVWVATRQTVYDADNGEWLDGGLSRFADGRWTLLSGATGGLPSDHLSALALDGRGKLWVGTGATGRGHREHAYRGWGLAVVDVATGRWERTYAHPTIASNNVTDLAVHGGELWVATAYCFDAGAGPGGTRYRTGGGVSVYGLASGSWRTIAAPEGLTPVTGPAGASGALLDLRSLLLGVGGAAWAGGAAYSVSATPGTDAPDGVIDVVTGGQVSHHRFPAAGAVTGIYRDDLGRTWVATERRGLFVWDGAEWRQRTRSSGEAPSDRLTVIGADGAALLVGTADSGLAVIAGWTAGPTPTAAGETATPTSRPQPTATPVAVVTATALPGPAATLFLPAAHNGSSVVEEPRASSESCAGRGPRLY